MVSKKKFNSIAHNIGHHAASGLSFMHPYLGEACQQRGINKVSLRLSSKEYVYLDDIEIGSSLHCATKELQNKLIQMVKIINLNIADMKQVILTFYFPPNGDHFLCNVKSELELFTGKIYIHHLRYFSLTEIKNSASKFFLISF